MNCCAISPLITDRENPKFHCVMAGGIGAREAALVKVNIRFILIVIWVRCASLQFDV